MTHDRAVSTTRFRVLDRRSHNGSEQTAVLQVILDNHVRDCVEYKLKSRK